MYRSKYKSILSCSFNFTVTLIFISFVAVTGALATAFNIFGPIFGFHCFKATTGVGGYKNEIYKLQ